MQELLTVLVFVGSGVTAGVMFCVALSLVPGFRALPYEEYVQAHVNFGRHFDKVMPPMVVLTMLCMAILLGLDGLHILNVASLVCLLGVSLVSQFANVPINRRVKSGQIFATGDPRVPWRRWHYVRLIASIAALILFSLWTMAR